MSATITKKKHQILQYKGTNNGNDVFDELLPETSADIVTVDNSSGHYGGNATDVQSALEELFGKNDYGYIELSSSNTEGTITDAQLLEVQKSLCIIKRGNNYFYKNIDSSSSNSIRFSSLCYHGVSNGTFNVICTHITLNTSTKAWSYNDDDLYTYTSEKINTLLSGKQDSITDGSATIASESNGIVTIKAGVSQSGGAISNSSDSDITLGASAKKGVATTISSSSTDSDLATAKAVYDAIDAIPEPMVFKGTLGTGGTITSLPTAGASNEGYTYKVIVAGTYASTSAKVGDVFVCAKPEGASSYSWILIPAGDDVEDTWRAIQVNGTQQLANGTSSGAVNFKNGTGINASYDSGVKYSLADGYGDTKNPYASKTKNYVLASPSSANGVPSFRALVAGDIPDLSATYQPKDADLTAIAGLTGTSGFLKKTASDTWSLDNSSYITGNETITLKVGSGVKPSGSGTANIENTTTGTTSLTLTLADSGVGANWESGTNFSAYSVVQVNAKGIVTGGNQLIEVGDTGQTTPSADLAIGGIFFKKI